MDTTQTEREQPLNNIRRSRVRDRISILANSCSRSDMRLLQYATPLL